MINENVILSNYYQGRSRMNFAEILSQQFMFSPRPLKIQIFPHLFLMRLSYAVQRITLSMSLQARIIKYVMHMSLSLRHSSWELIRYSDLPPEYGTSVPV